MGGARERIIHFIRKVLQYLLESQSLNDEGFLTLMSEVETIVNSRPLVSFSFTDTSQEPLTPNHLLLLQGNPNLPLASFLLRIATLGVGGLRFIFSLISFGDAGWMSSCRICYSDKDGLRKRKTCKLMTLCYLSKTHNNAQSWSWVGYLKHIQIDVV